ncbi:3-keto-disaccharide hydrolase [Tuwongella immobilis]|uniref:3-keto-alpha-glucoside-1,2-lyase/3-keto-2-hydroxy-glucal hydratase domain-containing protein n=1 Tax=Tuwongella immobilis TaxID=692036 RepID=A0A6C2YQR5_9BACT|nr:DUF1080 domain-containing protein [Tuwongella immobilis]VIP03499.1 Uncharacterized protein OS=Solibacter usitatus (strain Ellin6076) GN=Acid_0701 PE=4 SV=1: DUF1080 [Tuwongella immobilis]VTS04366.1 Uncharacterized protein OS=Solibacter usitatus (strain Ellin6076) GN=Acid_0701 PE=4 SV=1: DUF1080 [Tuwongella immobilis]
MIRYGLMIVMLLATVSTVHADDPWQPLFPTKDLLNWELKGYKNPPPDQWYFDGDILKSKVGPGWLSSKAEYRNFKLKFEWKVPEGGNSGVFLRVPTNSPANVSPSSTAVEIQMLDDNSDKYRGKLKPYQYSGGFYHFKPVTKSMFKGANEWNSYEITVNDDRISLLYNGELVNEISAADSAEYAKRPRVGHIGFQNHGTAVQIRNIQIMPLK